MPRTARLLLLLVTLGLGLVLAGIVALALVSSIQPLRLGYDDDRAIGLYRMQLVDYEMTEYGSDTGGVVVHERLGGPVAALRFLREGDVRR